MRGKWIKRLCYGASGVLALAMVALAGLLGWVATGPRSAAFLTPYIETALTSADGSFSARLEDTLLLWDGWRHPVDIRLKGTTLVTKDGATFARLPDISVKLDLSSLLEGRILPRSLVVRRPAIRLFQTEDGTLSFGFGADSAQGGVSFAEVMNGLSAMQSLTPDNASPASELLDTVVIDRADLSIGTATGAFVSAREARIVMRSAPEGITGHADIGIDYQGAVSHLVVNFTLRRDTPQMNLLIETQNLPLAAVERLVTGSESTSMLSGLPATGTVQAVLDTSGRLQDMAFQLNTGSGDVHAPDHFIQDIALKSARIRGTLSEGASHLNISECVLDFGGPSLSLNGDLRKVEGKYAMDLKAQVERLPVDALPRYWPKDLSPDSWKWVKDHITQGVVPKAQATIAIAPGDLDLPWLPDRALSAEVAVEGATVKYLDGHPIIKGVNGTVRFTGHSMTIDAQSGSALSATKLRKAHLHVADMEPDFPIMEIALDLEAPAKDVAHVLALPDIDVAKPIGLDSAAIQGNLTGSVNLRFPLYSGDVPPKNFSVQVGADASIAAGQQQKLLGTLDVSAVNAAFTLKDQRFQMEGGGVVDGVPATFSVESRVGGKEPANPHYRFKANVTQAQMAAHGYPSPVDFSGSAVLEADVAVNGAVQTTKAGLDFSQAVFAIPKLHWTKPQGAAAQLRLDAVEEAGKPALVKHFEFRATGLEAQGSAVLSSPGYRIQEVVLDRVSFGRTQLSARYRDRQGTPEISLNAAKIDLTPFFKEEDDFSPRDIPAIVISGEVGEMMLGGGGVLHGLRGALNCDAQRCTRADISGKTQSGAAFRHQIVSEGTGRKLLLNADNAGEFIRALGFSDNIFNGTLALEGSFDDKAPGNPLSGKLTINEYVLKNAPVLTKILTIGSFSGIVDTLGGNGISFSKLSAPYVFVNDVITLKGAKTYGSALGITLDGTIALKQFNLNVEGTVVPAYRLNTMIGNIPVVGEALAGGKGEGLFAAQYKVQGPYKNAEVKLNPLSILTPGFLRGLFDVFDAPASDGAAPAGKK